MPYRTEAIRITSTIDVRPGFVPNPSFDDPAPRARSSPRCPSRPRPGQEPGQGPRGTPPYLASLYEAPLLTREQEATCSAR